MTFTEALLNFLAYTVLTVCPLLVWPRKENIPAMLNVPFVVTAYLAPLFVFPYSDLYSRDTLDLLLRINVLGAFAMAVGVCIGYWTRFGGRFLTRLLPIGNAPGNDLDLHHRVVTCLALGVLGMAVSFAVMGFVPMFAEDPFLAKFFREPYKAGYDRVSVLYRLSQFTVLTLLPIAVATAAKRRDLKSVVVVLSAMGILGLSLTRGPVLEGILLVVGILAARSRRTMVLFLITSIVLYLLGSVVYVVLGLMEGGSLVESLSGGATDILDHLSFLEAFNPSTDQTYGITAIAGLLPGNQPYNPSVYTLAIVNGGADVDDIGSGGFRMPPSIWGYVSFSWPGVVMVCLLSGLIQGGATSVFRSLSKGQSLLNQTLLVIWFRVVVGFFANFYAMPYYGVLSIVLLLAVTRFGAQRRLITRDNVVAQYGQHG
jgi:hypothetical protein